MPSLLTDADGDEDAASRERRLRYRVLLAEYRTVLVLALVVLLALGGWVSYGAYADPGETQEQRLESEWTATGSFTHSSVVTESKAGYFDGQRLEEEPLYYEAITPTVDGEFDSGYNAARADNVIVDLRVELVYRAVDPDDDTVYWSERESLASVSESNVGPNETVTASVSVNVTDVRNSINEIETDLEASPGETEIFLVLERGIVGTINGEEQSTTDSYEVAIEGEGGTYRLESDGSYDKSFDEYTAETVAVSPGPVRAVGGPVLALFGLVGLGGVGAAMRWFPAPTREAREWLAYRDARSAFDEVITTASLPAETLDGPRADIESLATLAQLGIDLESPIVFDPDRCRYVVRGDDLRYVFDPPRLPVKDDVLTPVGAEHDGATASTNGVATDTLEPTETPPESTEGNTAGDSVDIDFEPSSSSETTASATEQDRTAEATARDDLTTDASTAATDEPITGPAPLSPLEPAAEAGAEPGSATEPDSEPGPTTESLLDTGSTTEIDDAELLTLAGLDPADLSDSDLFDLDDDCKGDRPSAALESVDDAAANRADDGSEHRSDTGS